jgi:peptide/nickel transport system permease protein
MASVRIFVGSILLGAMIGLATLAGWVAPQDPIQQDLGMSLFAPNRYHVLGTDRLGRDVMSRVAYGARVSLSVAAAATLLSALLGAAVGLAAGAAGGRVDGLLMRLTDLALAFPTLALLLVLAALYRVDSVVALVLLLGLTTWMPVARLVRAEAASLSRQRFMEAAASLGASPLRRGLTHLAPNVASTVVIAATLQVGEMMLLESGLSFLGLGVAPPTPSWGDMVRQGMPSLDQAWWVSTFPGLALALAVIGFNLLGDGFRDALDPRLVRTGAWVPRLGTLPPATS